MNKHEALSILSEQLAPYRTRSYADLIAMIEKGKVIHAEITGPSGTLYQIDIQVFWDNKANGDVRVSGAIDDGGLRAFFPLCDSFIMSPDGTFVGEDSA